MNDILIMIPLDSDLYIITTEIFYTSDIKSNICCYVRDYLFKNRGQIDMDVLSKSSVLDNEYLVLNLLPTIDESLDRIDLVAKPIKKLYIDCLLCNTSVMVHIKVVKD